LIASAALVTATASAATAQPDHGGALDANREAALMTAVADELRLSDLTLQYMEPPENPPASFEFTLDGAGLTVSLRRYSVRADDFHVYVPDVNGKLVEVPPPPVSTYRGEVVGVDGSAVSASLNGAGLTAMVHLPDDTVLAVQPVSDVVPHAPPGWHVVYFADSVDAGPWVCGNDDLHGVAQRAMPRHDGDGEPDEGPSAAEESDRIVDLYFDADVEFYQANNSSVDATVLDIERVVNAGDVIYRRDTGITQWIWGVIVRTGEPDPYNGTTAQTLLCEFRTFWNANLDNRSRDTAHLMTGKNLAGNTIGLAWTGVVCNVVGTDGGGTCPNEDNLAYGLSQSRYTNTWSLRVSLTAHELGHNWNASHCDGDRDCRIMCANNGGCTGVVTSFGSRARGEITTYKDEEADCLTGCWPGQFVPSDPETVLEAVRRACWGSWISIDARRYPENIRIHRAVRLQANGGLVVIGD